MKNQWIPLKKIINEMPVLEKFMYMGTRGHSGAIIYLFKHKDTRGYLNVDPDGNLYRYTAPGYTRVLDEEREAFISKVINVGEGGDKNDIPQYI